MAISTKELVIKEKVNIPRIKKAIKNLQSGNIDDTISSITFLIKELSKQPIGQDVQDLIKQLVNRLLKECLSMCESTRKKAIEELGKLTNELVKIKALESLRYVARAHRKRSIRKKAVEELINFKDLRGLRMVAQWGRYKEIRHKAVNELVRYSDLEGLRFVAQWNMYEDTIERAVKELERLNDLLIRNKDREGLKCIVRLSRDEKGRKKALEGLERLIDNAIEVKDYESMKLVAAYGTSKVKRLKATEEIKDIRALKFVIENQKNKCRETRDKAVFLLSEYIDELIRSKDTEALEYIAEFSKEPSQWKKAISEMHKMRDISKEERVTEVLHKIFLSQEMRKI